MSAIGKMMNKSQKKIGKEEGKLSKKKSRQYYSAPNLAHQHFYPRHDCGVNHDTRTQFKATPMPHYPSSESILTSSLHRKHTQKPHSYTQPCSRDDMSRSEESMLRPYWLDLVDGGNTFHPSKPFYPPGPQTWSEWDRIKRIKEAREAYKSPKTRDLIVKGGGPTLRRLSLESESIPKPKPVPVTKNPLRHAKVYSKSLPKINQIAVDKRRKESGSAASIKQQTEITLLDMQRMFPMDCDEFDETDGTMTHRSTKYIPAHEICYSELVVPVPDRPPAHSDTGTTLDDIPSANSVTNLRTYISQRHDTVGGYNSNWSSSYLPTTDNSRGQLNDSFTYSGNVKHISSLENMPLSVRSNTKEQIGKVAPTTGREIGLWLHKDILYQEETILPTNVTHKETRSPMRDEAELGLKRVTIEVSTMKEYHNPRQMNASGGKLYRDSDKRGNRLAISSIFYPMRKDYELRGTNTLIDVFPENASEAMLLTPLVEKASGFYVEETHSRAGIVQLCTPSGNVNSSSRNKTDRRPRSVILFDEKDTPYRQSNFTNESSRDTRSLNTRHGRAPDVVPRDDAEEVGTKQASNKPNTRNSGGNKVQNPPSKMHASEGNSVKAKIQGDSSKQSKRLDSGRGQVNHLPAKPAPQSNEVWTGTRDPYEKDNTDMTLSSDTTKLDSSFKIPSEGSGVLNGCGFDTWSRYDQLIYVPVEGPMEPRIVRVD